ncbi:uncharacterized protein LOC119352203 [Triticum dicoccoides]|uniref:uncharacterized protein LOC119352203 n=1 Tax=Triticum dicoccoides TaxID=85692 RepID=UPI00188F8B5D|nr:uncharacterized protein LOC119352203 [Triticum dicoccoides]
MDGQKIPGSVRLACGWVLLSACAMGLVHYTLSCSQAMTCKCDALTDTKAACFSALWIGTLCCAGSQATAAALALLLPRRPRWIIRELANFSVAVAGAGYCMFHGAIYIFHPGVYFALASIMFMLGDIICGMTLYLVGFVLLLLKSMAARLSDVLLHGEPPKHRNAFSSPISASPSSSTWSWRQEEEEQEGEDAGD